ncbi:MAG: adenosylcobinamide-GDP ribazoletransferase [Devosiaceae bacterium]|nr:adenosylcobinamide-GDP ribazoletransferase [Devosiaceae bacterium]
MKKQSSLSRPPVGNKNETVSTPSILEDIIMGIRFYSRLQIPKFGHTKMQIGRMAKVLGLASVIIGIIPGLILLLFLLLGLPILLSAGFALAAQIAITGAMAEDGLADSFDGLFGGNTSKNRLKIMKDSTNGTFGVVAIVLLIITRIAALGALATVSSIAVIFLWIGAQVLARQSALWLMVDLEAARIDGAAANAGKLSRTDFWLGMIPALLITIVFSVFFAGIGGIIIAAAIVMLIIVWWTRTCKKLIGGYSGDLIGGLQAMIEIGILSGFLLIL